jgi:purine-nucleoside phosphorylase
VTDPYRVAQDAADALATATGVERHDVAVVLGSGWTTAVERFGAPTAEVATADLPGFAAATVAGHTGRALSIPSGDRRLLVLSGRVHGYEGHAPSAVVHPVRTAVLSGCRTVVLTNAAGGIRDGLSVGQPVLIADHLDFTGSSPLTGPNPADLAPRFPDLTDCWTARLRALARDLDPSLVEGTYVGVRGPAYETPAEIRMFRDWGGDLVGMSTVHEAIAASHLGADVLGISLVTNLAAGLGDVLDHADVLRVAGESAERMGSLLADLIERL